MKTIVSRMRKVMLMMLVFFLVVASIGPVQALANEEAKQFAFEYITDHVGVAQKGDKLNPKNSIDVAWTRVQKADTYSVYIVDRTTLGTVYSVQQAANQNTVQIMTIPAGTLQPGHEYMVTISAYGDYMPQTISATFQTSDVSKLSYYPVMNQKDSYEAGDKLQFMGFIDGNGRNIETVYITYTNVKDSRNNGCFAAVNPNSKQFDLSTIPSKIIGTDFNLESGYYAFQIMACFAGEKMQTLDTKTIQIKETTASSSFRITLPNTDNSSYNNVYFVENPLTVAWNESGANTYYTVELRRSYDNQLVYNQTFNYINVCIIPGNLIIYDGYYQLSVVAKDIDGKIRYDQKQIYINKLKGLGDFSITSPTNNASIDFNKTLLVSWSAAVNAKKYTIYIAKNDSTFFSKELGYVTSCSLDLKSLDKNETYKIIVVATGDDNQVKSNSVLIRNNNTNLSKSDVKSIKSDIDSLYIIYTVGDWSNCVTKNLTLPTYGQNGSKITWTSSNPKIINSQGIVTRPEDKDTGIRLTAILRLGNFQESKTFDVIVKADQPSKPEKPSKPDKKEKKPKVDDLKKKYTINHGQNLKLEGVVTASSPLVKVTAQVSRSSSSRASYKAPKGSGRKSYNLGKLKVKTAKLKPGDYVVTIYVSTKNGSNTYVAAIVDLTIK